MRPVSANVVIDAPRERVFDLLCDLSRRPAFTDHFLEEYRLERLDPVGVGAAARFRLEGSGAWLDTQIEIAERPHLIREQGRGGPVNRLSVFTVWELASAASPQSCELTVTFWTEPKNVFDRLRNPLGRSGRLRRGWARAARRLKEVAESDEVAPAVTVAGLDRLPSAAR
ncbi:MAG TPA: SRPBCC family protein [Solirubrobacterales bacterium]|nr:SRPBCC family protein [Solirubrobacterales bacterium]